MIGGLDRRVGLLVADKEAAVDLDHYAGCCCLRLVWLGITCQNIATMKGLIERYRGGRTGGWFEQDQNAK